MAAAPVKTPPQAPNGGQTEASNAGRVFIVDDDAHLRALMCRWLEQAGFLPEAFADGSACLSAMSRTTPDAVLLDARIPDVGGRSCLAALKAQHPLMPVLVLTADSAVDSVVAAMQSGAYDYLLKPVERTKLVTAARNCVDRARMSARLKQLEREARGDGYPGIIGESVAMRELFRQLDRVASSDITTLIHGESGTGKELVARAIHAASGRSEGPFVALNCAAIPENLQESELFGHEKGAFTSAVTQRIGRFEQAHQGTLFLDEIGDLHPSAQAKLLRAIQERSFHRVGGTAEIEVDFRLVAATHRALSERVKSGQFREDLYFRIAVFELEVPPLRDRGTDVLTLARAFLGEDLALTEAVEAALLNYDWPGNVRELQNAMERGALLATDGLLQARDLPPRIERESDGLIPEAGPTSFQLDPQADVSLADLERLAIESAITRHSGNLSKVGRVLGIGRTTLYRKLKRYGIRE